MDKLFLTQSVISNYILKFFKFIFMKIDRRLFRNKKKKKFIFVFYCQADETYSRLLVLFVHPSKRVELFFFYFHLIFYYYYIFFFYFQSMYTPGLYYVCFSASVVSRDASCIIYVSSSHKSTVVCVFKFEIFIPTK